MNWLASDLYYYFYFADNFFRGAVPYKDYLVNYLPGAFLIFLAPRLFTAHTTSYLLVFSSLAMSLFLIGLSFLIRAWRKTKREKAWLGFLILSSVLILPLSLMRFDLFPTMLTLIALNVFLRKGSLMGEFFLGLGTVTKIFPAIFLPLFLINFWQKKEKRRILKGLLVYFLTGTIVLSPFIAFGDGEGIIHSLNYNFDRTIQIESVPASILFAGFLLGQPVETFRAFVSWNVSSGWDKSLTQVFLVLWIIAFAWLFFWFYQQVKILKGVRRREFLLIKSGLMAILITVSFSRTFSPQYLIWSWPFVLWFFLYLPRRKMMILGLLWCLILLVTMVNLAKFWDLISLNPAIVFSQILRNLLYLLFLVGIFLTKTDEKNTSVASLN